MVRRDLSTIDARSTANRCCAQVITFAATDRDVIDLVGASNNGDIAVLEFKAARRHTPSAASARLLDENRLAYPGRRDGPSFSRLADALSNRPN